MPVVDFHLHCYDRPLRALDDAGADYGVILSVPTMKGNFDAIRALPLSPDARDRILGGNAARIPKLP